MQSNRASVALAKKTRILVVAEITLEYVQRVCSTSVGNSKNKAAKAWATPCTEPKRRSLVVEKR